MVRFEPYVPDGRTIGDILYIPLWWDLNIGAADRCSITVVLYIPLWWDLNDASLSISRRQRPFTFHYGEIWTIFPPNSLDVLSLLYIPLWWDLNRSSGQRSTRTRTLHSTMVRFEQRITRWRSRPFNAFTFHYGEIWTECRIDRAWSIRPLHSTMVRFERRVRACLRDPGPPLHSTMVRFEREIAGI